MLYLHFLVAWRHQVKFQRSAGSDAFMCIDPVVHRRPDVLIMQRQLSNFHDGFMQPPALATQLLKTAEIVRQVTGGQSLDKALDSVDSALRPGVQALSFYTLRHLGLSQALLTALTQKAPPSAVQALLWVVLALCASEESEGSQTAAHTGVPYYKPYVLGSQAVQAAKSLPKTRAFAPLVNGVVRRFLRERDTLLAQVRQHSESARWAFQPWWIARVRSNWPDVWQAILHTAQQPSPMTLRVNAQWGTAQQAVKLLQEKGIEAHVAGSYAVELQTPMPVENIPGFAQGHFSVQAAAAQLAAPLLLQQEWVRRLAHLGRPLRVLDACAAPGGKTAHMLEMMPEGSIDVVALDVDAQRLQKVEETLARIHRSAELRAADAASADAFGADETFDAILLDAPCTASGIVRRHPDIRWLRRESDVAELSAQQRRLLQTLWPRLAPGGRLLYCTCSLFKAEGEENAQNFVLGHNDASRLPAPGHILPLAATDQHQMACDFENGEQGALTATDGFYYALFEK